MKGFLFNLKHGRTAMTEELSKTYDFRSTEQRLYKMWEEKGYFEPTNKPPIPGLIPTQAICHFHSPANVTGELHLGHAMFVSMEDLMIRYTE
jgi:valyl-tRNA synthetase